MPPHPRRRPPWRWALAGLLVAIASVAFSRLTAPGDSPGSLAVLPFRALDAASADDSLEVGLTDTLITRLSHSLSIPVRPMAAVLRYRDRPEDPLATGRALRVDAILEATFQKHNGKIRTSVRLLRVRDGKTLHAGVFDHGVGELFRLEDAISTELAGTLVLKLAPSNGAPGSPGTHNPVAYAAYLKGRSYWNQRTRPHNARSRSMQALPRRTLPWRCWPRITISTGPRLSGNTPPRFA
jgi:adenylate cyclase